MGNTFEKNQEVGKMPKVSVIVPMYNVEKYIGKCADSLLGQTLEDMEFIFVNDCTPDNSVEILSRVIDNYPNRKSQVRIVNLRQNRGLSKARFAGLQFVTGLFVAHCDGDDWVEPGMYERLYDTAEREGADVVVCDHLRDYPDGREVLAKGMREVDRIDILGGVLSRRVSVSMCDKLIRKSVYDRYGLTWVDGINLGEDFLFNIKMFSNLLRVSYLPEALYHYRRISGGQSYTNSLTFSSFKQMEYIYHWIHDHIDRKLYGREIFMESLNVAFAGVRAVDMPKRYYKRFVGENIPVSYFFRYRVVTLKCGVIFISKLFGYDCSKLIFRLFYRFVYK